MKRLLMLLLILMLMGCTSTPTPVPTPTPEPTPEPVVVSYNILLHGEGGSPLTQTVQGVVGETLPDSIQPVRPGYEFLGFWTQRQCTGTYYYDWWNVPQVWDIARDTTLYACWHKW